MKDNRKIRFGMFTSGYQRYPLEMAFKDAARFGYDYIELWGGIPHAYPYDLKAGELKNVLALEDKYEMPVEVYTPEHNAYPFNFMIGGDIHFERCMDYLKTALDMGKAMGAEYTLISAGHAGNTASEKEIRRRLYRALDILSAYAETLDHKILLEPLTVLESNVCPRAGILQEILEEAASPALFGMCDIVVPFVEHEPVMDYFYKLGSHMAHLHIVDSDGVSEVHYVPGEGKMPLKDILNEVVAFGYCGRATIELVTNYIDEPGIYAKRALDYFNFIRKAPENG